MSLLRWIWAYLFDSVHSNTWPHQNRIGDAYVCCLDCGKEIPYSLEYMHIAGQHRNWSTSHFRFSTPSLLIIAPRSGDSLAQEFIIS